MISISRENYFQAGLLYSDRKGRIDMGAHKKVSRPKDPATKSDPHYTEFDTHKERNIQKPLPRRTP